MCGGQLPDTEVAGPYPFDVDKLRNEVQGAPGTPDAIPQLRCALWVTPKLQCKPSLQCKTWSRFRAFLHSCIV